MNQENKEKYLMTALMHFTIIIFYWFGWVAGGAEDIFSPLFFTTFVLSLNLILLFFHYNDSNLNQREKK